MYWVMKKELPHTTTFPELVDLAKDLGCSYLNNVKVGNKTDYTSERSKKEMVTCLGKFNCGQFIGMK